MPRQRRHPDHGGAPKSRSDRPATDDTIWVCRRLAAALHQGMTILHALESALTGAPAGPRALLEAMRENLVSEGTAARGLIPLRFPSFIWGTVLSGELCGGPGEALALLADRLEAEQASPAPQDRILHLYSLALGRLGLMRQVGVPMLQALEAAAESVDLSDVRDAIGAAREAVGAGAELSDALERVAAGLPAAAVDMIRDGEESGRLPQTLSVVSDYLLDEASRQPARSTRKGVANA